MDHGPCRSMSEGRVIRPPVWVVGAAYLLGEWLGSLYLGFRRGGAGDGWVGATGVSCMESSSSRQSCRTLNLLVMAVVGDGTLGWMNVDGGTSDGGIEALER